MGSSWRRLAEMLGSSAGTTGSWQRRFAEGIGSIGGVDITLGDKGSWARRIAEGAATPLAPDVGSWARRLGGDGPSGSWAKRLAEGSDEISALGGGGGAPFSPTDIANLTLWLDAASGVTTDGTTPAVNDDTVQQWNDRSSAGNNATQATGALRPTYKTNIIGGKPVLRFSAHRMATASFLDSGYNTALTFFIVSQVTNNGLILSSSNSGTAWFTGRSAGESRFNTNALSDTDFRAPMPGYFGGAPLVEAFRYNGSTKVTKVNRFAVAQENATGNLGLSGVLTIGDFSTTGFPFIGDIAEMLVYKRALTDAEIIQVEDYLLLKYSLATQAGLVTALPLIACLGDSITSQYANNAPIADSYPSQLQALLGGDGAYHLANCGVQSRTTATWLTSAASQFIPCFNAAYAKNIALVFTGTNDLNAGADAATTITRCYDLCDLLQAAAVEVILFTILPRGADGTFETNRQTVNTDFRANFASHADGLCDVGNNSSIMGAPGAQNNASLYGDTIHPTAVGNGHIATDAQASVLALP